MRWRGAWLGWPLWLLLLVGCGGEDAPGPRNGDLAPPFLLSNLEGERMGLPRPGEVVAVRFWADWCPFCAGEMLALGPVYDRLRPRGLTILAVNVRQDRATARAFIAKLGVAYETLLDEDGAVARRYGVRGLPSTFLIGRDGRLVGRILGESSAAAFEAMVAPLL